MNRYENIKVFREVKDDSTLGRSYRKGVKYPLTEPSEDDVWVITTVGDRYDLLAFQYYGDTSLWWVINIANTGDYSSDISFNSIFIPPGTQLRIPNDVQTILSDYSKLNG